MVLLFLWIDGGKGWLSVFWFGCCCKSWWWFVDWIDVESSSSERLSTSLEECLDAYNGDGDDSCCTRADKGL